MMRKFDKQSLFSWSPAALLKLAASSGAFLGGAVLRDRSRYCQMPKRNHFRAPRRGVAFRDSEPQAVQTNANTNIEQGARAGES